MKFKLLHVVTLDPDKEPSFDLYAGTLTDFSEYLDSSTEDGVNIVQDEEGKICVLDINDGKINISDESPGTAEYCLLATCLMEMPLEILAKYVASSTLSHCDWQIQDLVRNRLEGLI